MRRHRAALVNTARQPRIEVVARSSSTARPAEIGRDHLGAESPAVQIGGAGDEGLDPRRQPRAAL